MTVLGRYRVPAGAVWVPEHLARRLDVIVGTHRIRHRGEDPELDALLNDLHTAGLDFVAALKHDTHSADGTSELRTEAVMASSAADEQMSTSEVAAVLGVQPRSVTALAVRGSLQGRKRGREWWFEPADVEEFRAKREGQSD